MCGKAMALPHTQLYHYQRCCTPTCVAFPNRWTVAPGDTGSTLLFYARVTDIILGVIIVLFFDLIFPWCNATLDPCRYCEPS